MVNILYKQIFITLSLCVLFGCASQEEAADGGVDEGHLRSTDCISKSSIRDYKVLDDSNLIITEGASRVYHMALDRRAFGLRSSRGIGFQSSSSRVCAGFDSMVVEEGFGPETYRIKSIRRLTPEQAQNLLVRFGLAEPEFEQPRQPQEVEGAEVEELD